MRQQNRLDSARSFSSSLLQNHFMRCEVCYYETDILIVPFGGLRPRPSYRKPAVKLCAACRHSLDLLKNQDRLHFRCDPSLDTTNSRFAIIKVAIKRNRFGNVNMSQSEIKNWIRRHPKRAAGTNPRALGTNPKAKRYLDPEVNESV